MKKVNLFIDYYHEAWPERRAEYLKCLAKNHGAFDRIIDVKGAARRTTFREFAYAAAGFPGDVNVVSNLDMWFDGSVRRAERILASCELICLLRWDAETSADTRIIKFRDSWRVPHLSAMCQDSWMFVGDTLKPLAEDLNFPLGVVYCDNVLALQAKRAGLRLRNPYGCIASWHEHRHRRSEYTAQPLSYPQISKLIAVFGAGSVCPEFCPLERIWCPCPGGAEKLLNENSGSPSGASSAPATCIVYACDEDIGRAFASAGCAVEPISWFDTDVRGLAAAVEASEPDFVFFQAPPHMPCMEPGHKDGPEALRAIERIRAKSCLVGWCGDVLKHISTLYAFSQFCHFFFHTQRNALRGSRYLAIGYDPARPDAEASLEAARERSGIIFCGNRYSIRRHPNELRNALVVRFADVFKDQFVVHGKTWQNSLSKENRGEHCAPYGSLKFYGRKLIALDAPNMVLPLYYSNRLLLAQAAGCLVLSQRFEGIEDLHPHAVPFDTVDEAVELAEYYLAHPREAIERGRKGREHVLAHHTWKKRAEHVLDVISGRAPAPSCSWCGP